MYLSDILLNLREYQTKKRMKYSNLFVLMLACFLIFSCKKIDGCTDPLAINYNTEANQNDGTCQYPTSLDSGTIYFFSKNDTIIFLGDTLSQMPVCPTESEILQSGYSYKMRIDKDYFDGDYTGQTYFSFGDTENNHFSFQGHLQKKNDNELELQVLDIVNNYPGINPSVNSSCLPSDPEKEVVIIDF